MEQVQEESSNYYEVLGITPEATEDDIKRGYRKMALKYHPDKAGSSPEAALKFSQVSKAYETLSNPKMKQIYDKYGERGLEMMKQMGDFEMLPEIMLFFNRFLAVLSFLTILLIIFPSLLQARIDGKSQISYFVCFIPIFIIDFCGLVVSVLSFIYKNQAEMENPEIAKAALRFKIIFTVYLLLFIALQIILCLQLDNTISISWTLVFLPWMIMEAFSFIFNFISSFSQSMQPFYEQIIDPETGNPKASEPRALKATEIFLIWAQNFYSLFIRVIQLVLVTLKLNNPKIMPWGVVFLPIWIHGVSVIIKLSLEYVMAKRQKSTKPELIQKNIADWVMFVIWASLFYSFIGLLITRLGSIDNVPAAATIFIPIFILLSFMLCCFGCCMPCIVRGAQADMEQQLYGEPNVAVATNTIVVSPDRLIQS